MNTPPISLLLEIYKPEMKVSSKAQKAHIDWSGRDFLFGDGCLIEGHPITERRGLGEASICKKKKHTTLEVIA